MTLTQATIKVGAGGTEVPVQFNPVSLRVTTTNQFDDDHPDRVSKPTSFKLDVELLFDSTEDGSDIYQKTRAIRDAATATAQGASAASGGGSGGKSPSGGAANNISLVVFKWGTTIYQGYIESLNETLDYWSSDGVPLRSTIQISLKGTAQNFLTGTYGKVASYASNPAPALPAIVRTSAAVDKDRVTRVAGLGGDGSTGRGIAALNGLEDMRGGGLSAGAGFSAAAGAAAAAGLAVGGGAQLQAAAGFKLAGGVSAGASIGFGMGASAGFSAAAGLGASVGVGMAAGAGIGLGGGLSAGGAIGMSASAGFNAGAGVGMGFGVSASVSVTGLDGVTHSSTSAAVLGPDGTIRTSSSTMSGSGSAGLSASAGAFAGLGASRTTMPGANFDADRLLPPPLGGSGSAATYDVSGRAVSSDGQVAASYSARAGVTVW